MAAGGLVPLREPGEGIGHANGVMVFTPSGEQICAMTRCDTSVLRHFELPATLPA